MEINSSQPSRNTHPVCLPPPAGYLWKHTALTGDNHVVTHPPDDGITEQQEFEENIRASVTVSRISVVGHVV